MAALHGRGNQVKLGFCASSIFATLIIAGALPLFECGVAHAAIASIYGGSDGLCGHRTANGERLNCAAMTAAHRTLPFGTRIVVVWHCDAAHRRAAAAQKKGPRKFSKGSIVTILTPRKPIRPHRR
jgi:hypothetical protein